MARKRRVDVPGAVYHVTARGNHQQRIFYTAEDYTVYLSLLREASHRFGLKVVAYALLPNHVHILCRRGPVPLAKVMHHVQRRFAVHHNRRLGVRGHVFDDRYHAKLCENEEYLWAVVRYIHDNPVQAGLCDRPDAYPWTSYHAYASGQWDVVDQQEALRLFGAPGRVRDLPARPRVPAGNGGQVAPRGKLHRPRPAGTPRPRPTEPVPPGGGSPLSARTSRCDVRRPAVPGQDTAPPGRPPP